MMREHSDRLRHTAQVIALALAYLVVAKLGLMLDAVSGFATLVWPATGLALAALLLFGSRLWPGVALGAVAVNLWIGAPFGVALGIGAGNTLEAVLGAYALRRISPRQLSFDRIRSVIGLIGFGALASTTVSATVGVVSLRLGGIVRPDLIADTWLAWWVGDALGDLVVAPLLLVWWKAPRIHLRSWRLLEAAALGAAFVGIGLAVFFVSPSSGPFRRTYMTFPLLIWAALRFGPRGATAATFVTSAIAIWSTAAGLGPFVRDSLSAGLLNLQVFMAIAAATALLLGAAISERTEASRKREEVLAIVSHDLKNPLSVIQMSLDLMEKHLEKPEVVRSKIATVQRSLTQMNLLIRDLLDLAAMDASRLSLNLGQHEGDALVREAVERARPLALERAQTLVVAPPDSAVLVKCDRDRVLQVLSNLIDNAVKFTPKSGIVSVKLDKQPNGNVRFAVTDTGPGIEPGQIRSVFERFWQAQPGVRVGTGLGLSIVKGIVEAHGGNAWAESKVGQGSTFYFTLPPSRRDTAKR